MLPMRLIPLATLLCFMLLAGCNLRQGDRASTPPASARDLRLSTPGEPTAKALPTASNRESTAPTPEAKSDATSCGDSDEARPARQIDANAAVDYAAKTVSVEQRINFANRENAALDSIALDVQANQWDDSFALESLTVNGVAVDYKLEANRLDIAIPPLSPGCALHVELRYQLTLERIRDGLRAYRGFLGYSPRQLNLAHFLPTVAARIDGDWRIHPPAGIGEQIVHEPADWRVALTVSSAPESLRLAAPGGVETLGTHQWRVTLEGARDFAISLGDGMKAQRAATNSGATVEVYAFDEAGGQSQRSAENALREIIKAMAVFERLYGVYPRGRFVIVQGDFPDGMEFSGLVFVGSGWFAASDGTNRNYLTLVAVHELAHQWWYGQVGSDSAMHPWLDEALATYSEYLYIEAAHPDDRNWWWSFRVAPFQPRGAVDSDVFGFDTMRDYINTIYLRGAQMLHNLRDDLGDEAFFGWLRAYLEAGSDGIAGPSDFWALLNTDEAALTLETRREFLGDPGVGGLFDDAPG